MTSPQPRTLLGLCLLPLLAACLAPPPTETSGGHAVVAPEVLDALHAAGSFDEAVQIALGAGLQVVGSIDPSADGRRVVIVEPSAPEVVVAALGEALQVATTGTPNFKTSDAVAATCKVDGTDARVMLWSDGKIYALQGRYNVDLKLCAPGSSWNCDRIREVLGLATAALDTAGGAQRGADGPGGREQLVVTVGRHGEDRVADAMTVADGSGRRTCNLRISETVAQRYLDDWTDTNRRYIQKVLMHEIGHCMGLDHADRDTPLVMAPQLASWDFIPTSMSDGEKAALRAVSAGRPVPVSECTFTCGANAVYDAARNRCQCKGGAPVRPAVRDCAADAPGPNPEGPPPGRTCGCDDWGQCVDDHGDACGACPGGCAQVCECEWGACVDVATGRSCSACPFDCHEERTCGCEDGACVDEVGEPCDACDIDCEDVTTRVCGCSGGACIDFETGAGCDLCPDDCDDDNCDDFWGCC